MGGYSNYDMDLYLNRDQSIKPIAPSTAVHALGAHWQSIIDRDFDRDLPEEPDPDEAKDHFSTLVKAALKLDHRLKAAGVPYRFCVYKKGDQILVEMIKLDETGRAAEGTVQNITHDEFYRWVSDFDAGEGLLFDESG